MGEQWPDGGPWVVVPTSAEVDWEAAVAALTAASSVRVAAVAVGSADFGSDGVPIGGSGGRVGAGVAAWVELRDTDDDPLELAETCDLVAALARTYGLVLVAGVPGLLVPVGRAGWTMTDLAARLGAPVVVVTGDGPDAADHTTRALHALTVRGLAGAVVTVGDGPSPGDAKVASDRSPGVGDPASPEPGASVTSAAPSTAPGVGIPASPEPGASVTSAAPGGQAAPDRLSGGADEEGSAAAPADGNRAITPAGQPTPDAADRRPAVAAHEETAVPPPGSDSGPPPGSGSVPPPGSASDRPPVSDQLADRLPVKPAGRIPAGAATPDRKAARGFLDPILHASAGPAAAPPALAPAGLSLPATSGVRVTLALVALFVVMSLSAVGLAFCERPAQRETAAEPATTAPATPRWRDTPPAPRPSSTGVPVEDICPVNQLRAAPARPGPQVTDRVDAAWERIEKWLAVKAPESRASLGPGAGIAEIDAAQRRMSVPFPPDLVASLLRHDGTGDDVAGFPLPYMYPLMSVAGTVEAWWERCENTARYYTPGDVPWWDNEYVPFAGADDRGLLVADQREPAVTGRVAEFGREHGVQYGDWPASVAELLEQVATSLETGEPFAGRYRPALAGDRLEWVML